MSPAATAAVGAATEKVWVELYQPLVTEGFEGMTHYTGTELAVISDYLHRGRQLHQHHTTRVRAMLPTKRRNTP